MFAVGDAFFSGPDGLVMGGGSLLDRSEVVVGILSHADQPWIQQGQRHGGSANIVFCDGHVEARKNRVLFFDTRDTALRPWNIDHEPHR
jgi:prepilin-type processing-associated H-X9-DG protein